MHASPVEEHFIVTAGNDQFVRLYDRRNMSGSVKKFCPQHLVSLSCENHITMAFAGLESMGGYESLWNSKNSSIFTSFEMVHVQFYVAPFF